MNIVTRDTVEEVEFGTVFEIDESGVATERKDVDAYNDIYLESITNGRESWYGIPEGWELVSGLTGQYCYNGPIMHASEYADERLMKWLYADESPNLFMFATYSDMTEWEEWEGEENERDTMGEGWLILRKI